MRLIRFEFPDKIVFFLTFLHLTEQLSENSKIQKKNRRLLCFTADFLSQKSYLIDLANTAYNTHIAKLIEDTPTRP